MTLCSSLGAGIGKFVTVSMTAALWGRDGECNSVTLCQAVGVQHSVEWWWGGSVVHSHTREHRTALTLEK